MSKERFQTPNVGDTIKLRFLVLNSNQYKDVNAINKVEIIKVDDSDPTNQELWRVVEEIDGSFVTNDSEGQYSLNLELIDPTYVVGKYIDRWFVAFEQFEQDENEIAEINQMFEVVRDLWMTTPVPLVYDFSFTFKPNKIRKGSKQHLIIDVRPNVPTASEMQQYYMNLAVNSPIRISISQRCGDCVPMEEDLRLVVDCDLVELRELCRGFYFLDTTEMDLGIYDVWFQLEFAESVYVSPNFQLQIFD
jgi:hypothetical protein